MDLAAAAVALAVARIGDTPLGPVDQVWVAVEVDTHSVATHQSSAFDLVQAAAVVAQVVVEGVRMFVGCTDSFVLARHTY